MDRPLNGTFLWYIYYPFPSFWILQSPFVVIIWKSDKFFKIWNGGWVNNEKIFNFECPIPFSSAKVVLYMIVHYFEEKKKIGWICYKQLIQLTISGAIVCSRLMMDHKVCLLSSALGVIQIIQRSTDCPLSSKAHLWLELRWCYWQISHKPW